MQQESRLGRQQIFNKLISYEIDDLYTVLGTMKKKKKCKSFENGFEDLASVEELTAAKVCTLLLQFFHRLLLFHYFISVECNFNDKTQYLIRFKLRIEFQSAIRYVAIIVTFNINTLNYVITYAILAFRQNCSIQNIIFYMLVKL